MFREQLNIPAAWKKPNSADYTYRVTAEDIAEMDQSLEHIKRMEVPLRHLTKYHYQMPKFADKLILIRHCLESDLGFFMIRGIPVEKYTEAEIRIIYWGIGLFLGTLLPQSVEGELIMDVRDSGDKIGKKFARGTKSADNLPFHTDRCDVVSLMCLHKPLEGGKSRIVSAATIHNEILRRRPDLLEVLYEPYYHMRQSWESKMERDYYPLPIFSRQNGHFACRFLRRYINFAQELPEVPALTTKQLEALNLIEEIANDDTYYLDIDMEPGDIQLLNNYVVLHSRTAYVDGNEDENTRFLLRFWLAVPNSRPLVDMFKPVYGETSAGSIRGGIWREVDHHQLQTQTA